MYIYEEIEFEWDEAKNLVNQAKHGIRFEDAAAAFQGPMITLPDRRLDYGEERFVSTGLLGTAVIVVVVHADRDNRVRLISARKANRQERKKFYGYLEGKARRD